MGVGKFTNIKHITAHVTRRSPRLIEKRRAKEERCSLLIRREAFNNLVEQIAAEFSKDVAFSPQALQALQHGAESFMVEVFEDAHLLAIHRHDLWVTGNDIQLALRVRNDIVMR